MKERFLNNFCRAVKKKLTVTINYLMFHCKFCVSFFFLVLVSFDNIERWQKDPSGIGSVPAVIMSPKLSHSHILSYNVESLGLGYSNHVFGPR